MRQVKADELQVGDRFRCQASGDVETVQELLRNKRMPQAGVAVVCRDGHRPSYHPDTLLDVLDEGEES